MDLETAKELDLVLREIYGTTNSTITRLNRPENMKVRFPLDAYVEYLNELELIKNSTGQKYAYNKTLKGHAFVGFENQIKNQGSAEIQAEENRKSIYTLTVLTATGTFGLLMLEAIKFYYKEPDWNLILLFFVGIIILYLLLRKAIVKLFL